MFFVLFAYASFVDMSFLHAEDQMVVHIWSCMMLREALLRAVGTDARYCTYRESGGFVSAVEGCAPRRDAPTSGPASISCSDCLGKKQQAVEKALFAGAGVGLHRRFDLHSWHVRGALLCGVC
jgi:hypothetical protein